MARNFSGILSKIARGERVEVVRNGVAVAQMLPVRPEQALSAERWRELMAGAPSVDEDFERDLEEARKAIGPPDSEWQS